MKEVGYGVTQDDDGFSEDEEAAYQQLLDAVTVAFSGEPEKLGWARSRLRELGDAGRIDAWFYLGKTYEAKCDYEQAEQLYQKGAELGHTGAIFRLSLLHKRCLASDPDKNYYLKASKALSEGGHLIGRRNYVVEMIKGSYGLHKIPIGLLSITPVFIGIIWLALKNRDDTRLLY